MKYYKVCPLGVIGGREDLLTYGYSDELAVGTILKIPYGKKTKLGILISETSKPSFKTKEIESALEEVVPKHLIALGSWISQYYASRLSVVLQSILPKGLDKKRQTKEINQVKTVRSGVQYELNSDQKNAVDEFLNSKQITHLVHGITGSGKTRVYQEVAKKVLKENRSVLILVPEIALTPQLAAEFQDLNDNVLIMHSGLSEAQRHKNWRVLNQTIKPWVIVGPRSSLFSPVTNLGLIVVDEFHEPSYSQDSQPKYSALRVARKLAELSDDCKIILGSATPSVTDYYYAVQTKSPIINLPRPTNVRNTSVEIVDMRIKEDFGTHPLFSRKLIEAMNNALAQNEQIMLFHNRRGTARMSLCVSCGWTAQCPNCHIPMRLHHDFAELRCHTCGHKSNLPKICPECKSPDIDFKGFGSKRIESEIIKLYPDSVVARFDGDTPLSEQLHHRYQDLFDNKINIIIGTQGIAKGLDLPNLTTVGIVHADSELFIPDFSSSERSFQLTTQVIGRAGRTGKKSAVIIQTLNPDHPAIIYSSKQDFIGFYNYEINERTAEHMPPKTFLLQLSIGYASSKSAENAALKLASEIKNQKLGVLVRGPSPAFHEHRGKLYYQQLVISSPDRSNLVKLAKNIPSRWQFTLDPINLL